ncbi:site-specific integrase [Flavivirga sp. 57AJ16]|uniref:tyrosine-type recombinase/integrase n=1 Tax=Flavivirga sp. 57AJ16 TaxID=3025307 RepID=UPI002366C06C|nr:site-specific integrase [Flavivirga sp. 57AJ16]MDD7887874.1 integrase arm-type DNA-binding domain-containing protein [Flavivirga sp. 57AJ16]
MSHNVSLSDTHFPNQNPNQKGRRFIKFTDLTIKSLKPSEKRIDYWCNGLQGFGIRISPKGTKTWFYLYQFHNKQRRMSFGHYPKVSLAEALSKYSELNNSIDFGVDPLAERDEAKRVQDEELTVSQLIELYLEHCKKSGKKSYKTDERELKKDIVPILGNHKITEVQPKELAKVFHHIIVEREAPGAATHLYSYVRRLFNFAAEMGLMRRRDNPCLDIKLKIPKNRRQRHLNPEEIYRFWHTLDNILMADISRVALRFLICTVARSNEVRAMKWSHVDLNSRIWTMPTSKNGRMHRVYLGDLAMKLLNEARNYTDGKSYVFGSTGKISTCGIDKENLKMLSGWALSQPIRRHFDEFGITERFYPHDLRRTGATMIAGLFGRRDFAAMALNHTNKDATDVYDQYVYDIEKKLTLNALNKAIEIIVNSPNVESVPNFDEIRSKIIKPKHQINLLPDDLENDKSMDFSSSFSNPVTYKLSYDHGVLRKPI